MNQATAKTKFIRMSPRKLRLVADAVRGSEVNIALAKLRYIRKRAALPLAKAIKQALANAKIIGLSAPLKISHLSIDKGPIFKRWRAVSRGQAHGIQKHTAHINVIVTSDIPGLKKNSNNLVKTTNNKSSNIKNSKSKAEVTTKENPTAKETPKKKESNIVKKTTKK